MTETQKEILNQIKRLLVDCPDCESMSDDDQYTCTTCWCEGGNGKIKVIEWIDENWDEIRKEASNG